MDGIMTEYYKISDPEGNPLSDSSHFVPVSLNQIMRENGLVKGGWVSCSRRLPDENKNVLVVVSGCDELKLSFYDEDGWNEVGSLRNFDENLVTHWQPLPTPPSEDAEKDTIQERVKAIGQDDVIQEMRNRGIEVDAEKYEYFKGDDSEYDPDDSGVPTMDKVWSERDKQWHFFRHIESEYYYRRKRKQEEKKPEYDDTYWNTDSEIHRPVEPRGTNCEVVEIIPFQKELKEELYQNIIKRLKAEGYIQKEDK